MSGFFYLDTNESEEKIEERKKEDEAQEIADETLALVANAPNDAFPAFLWEPQINEFEVDDGYQMKAACTNPAVLKAYDITKKYQDYWDYVEAMDAYVEYVKYIEDTYGDFGMMLRAYKEGYGTIFIPALPKLTHKKKNKLLLESGFMPSRIDEEFIPPEGSVEITLDQIPEGELEEDENAKLPKRIRRIQERMLIAKGRIDRQNMLTTFATGTAHQGMDAILQFLTSSNSDSFEKRGSESQSISEAMEDLHTYDFIPEEIADWMALPQNYAIMKDGFYQDKAKVEYQELIKTLENNGFDFLFSSAVEGMDKEAVRALHREFQDFDINRLPKKERKRYKKELKEKEKRRREMLCGDRKMRDVLLANRIHLTRDSEFSTTDGINPDFVNFHLSDAFPMGDE